MLKAFEAKNVMDASAQYCLLTSGTEIEPEPVRDTQQLTFFRGSSSSTQRLQIKAPVICLLPVRNSTCITLPPYAFSQTLFRSSAGSRSSGDSARLVAALVDVSVVLLIACC